MMMDVSGIGPATRRIRKRNTAGVIQHTAFYLSMRGMMMKNSKPEKTLVIGQCNYCFRENVLNPLSGRCLICDIQEKQSNHGEEIRKIIHGDN